MSSLDISGRKVGSEEDAVFFIAEIGQNHQGDLNIAQKMIAEAKRVGCDCVKFQKSDLTFKFTKFALERPYKSENSWGSSYGEHKTFLEFSIEQYKFLQSYAHSIGILFTASAMDIKSLEVLESLDVPFIKIGSGDANNFPLLKKAANLEVPLIISTGMQSLDTIKEIVKIMTDAKKRNYALMHCVSSYPTKPEDCNLRTITLLQDMFPSVSIGYSGHEVGINITSAAINLGARIVERHFTLDKNQKGSDHKCSLIPDEFGKLISRTRNGYKVELLDDEKSALKVVLKKEILNCELNCRMKLGKSLVYKRNIEKGSKIDEDDIIVKVTEPFGISAEYIYDVIGKILQKDAFEDCNVGYEDF